MRRILIPIFLLIFMALIINQYGPDLLNDYQLRDLQTAESSNHKVIEANCKAYVGLVSFCDIEFQNIQNTSLTSKELNYMIFDNMGGKPVSLLEIENNQDLITSNVGLEYFYNRLIFFVTAILLLFLAAFKIIVFGVHKDYR